MLNETAQYDQTDDIDEELELLLLQQTELSSHMPPSLSDECLKTASSSELLSMMCYVNSMRAVRCLLVPAEFQWNENVLLMYSNHKLLGLLFIN